MSSTGAGERDGGHAAALQRRSGGGGDDGQCAYIGAHGEAG